MSRTYTTLAAPRKCLGVGFRGTGMGGLSAHLWSVDCPTKATVVGHANGELKCRMLWADPRLACAACGGRCAMLSV